jgi:nucleoside-diphosphate-sugar epimerase
MNVFVTGGTGYMPSALVSRLTDEEEVSRVVVLARDSRKAHDLATRVKSPERLEFAHGDLRLHNFDFGNIDAVFHAAAVHDLAWVDENCAEAIEINVGGTHRVVEAARRYRVPYFIFVSSHSVYDTENDTLAREENPRPRMPKALTKYAGELIVRSLADSSTRFIVLRPSHIYGVSVMPHWNDFTEKFTTLSCTGKNLTIYGDGGQEVDIVHVKDVVDCVFRLLISTEDIWNETYNLGGGRPISINELADVFIKATSELGLRAPTKSYVKAKSWSESKGYRLPCLDMSKVRDKVSWSPSTSIEEGVRELIGAYVDQNNSYYLSKLPAPFPHDFSVGS